MARIAGINVPDKKHTWVALTSIYGIGRTRALAICESTGIGSDTKIRDLSEAELETLRGKRGAFTRAAEATTTSGRPGKCVTLAIGNCDDRVVERSVNVRDAVRHVAFDLLFRTCFSWFCHN